MPWRRKYYWRPRRRRWFYRRRPRRTFYRRTYRNWVRKPKRKLKRLHLTQYQPSTIRLTKIKGLLPLVMCNVNKLGNNLVLYENAITPELLPGGGGFSVSQLSLDSLYLLHQYVKNWWTRGNDNLPLVRYLKCRLKLYQSEDVDYLFRYQRHYPMETNQLTNPSTQPSLMMMLNKTIFIPSKRTNKWKKPYKKITIKPPELLSNKWFFQYDIAKKPLVVFYATAASFDHYYINTSNMSDNVTIPMLNTNMIQNRYMGNTHNYYIRKVGTEKIFLWATFQENIQDTNIDAREMIPLTDIKNFTEGKSYNESKNKVTGITDWKTFKQNLHIIAGNPFHKLYTNPEAAHNLTLLISKGNSPEDALPDTTSDTQKITPHNTTITYQSIIVPCRYNPNNDKGDANITYLLNNYREEHGWDEPANHKLILSGYPMYILWWGFLDFQRQQKQVQNIETSQILVAKSNQFHPELPAYVPLNYDFTHGKSPYEPDINPLDEVRWYPMVQYQENAVNNLLSCGPGTAKLNGKKTVEAKCEYCFYFKFGGNPPPMVTVKNPREQPQYPIPSNFQQTNSLQDPKTPIEAFLYNFDERRHLITKTSAERISKYPETKDSLFTDSTTTRLPTIQTTSPQTSEHETSDSEKEEETLLNQLLKQRKKQRRLKQRIQQLISQQNM
nr:MAG: ORF1 [TTV-like mini virus]